MRPHLLRTTLTIQSNDTAISIWIIFHTPVSRCPPSWNLSTQQCYRIVAVKLAHGFRVIRR